MKKFKKVISLCLVFGLCVSSLVGCSGGVDKSKKKPKADKDDVTITVWSNETSAQAVYEKLVDEWNATEGDKKNIFIEWETTTDSTQIDVAQQSGQLPHLFNATGKQCEKFISLGDLAAINELPGGEEFLEEFDQEPTEGANLIDGKTYWVYPIVRTAALVYNKDLFKKAGIVDKNGEPTPPKTLSEVVEYAKKIRALDNSVYGFIFPLGWAESYPVRLPLSSYYKPGFTKDSQVYIDFETLTVDYSNYKEMFQWLFDMEKDGSMFPGSVSLDNDSARAYFAEGMIGMIPAVSWDVGVYTEQFPAKCDWGVAQYPAPDSREFVGHWNDRGSTMVMSKKAADKNPEEIMEVYKFLYSMETRTTIFEEGINLSMKKDVLENYDKKKTEPHFAKFSEFVNESARYAVNEKYTIEGETWKQVLEKAWVGNITLDQAIADMSERATTALRKAVKVGEYDVERQKNVERYLNGEDDLDLSLTH